MSTSNKHLGGNTFSPATTTEAATEWTTEDFLAAEPYPMPDITEEMVRAFLDKTTPPTSKGGSTSPGGDPPPREAAMMHRARRRPWAILTRRPSISMRCWFLTRPIRIARSVNCSSNKGPEVTLRLRLQSERTGFGPRATACILATASPAAGQPTWSSCQPTRTARRPLDSSPLVNSAAEPTGTSMAIRADFSRTWAPQSSIRSMDEH
jgi:hypothetical protein